VRPYYNRFYIVIIDVSGRYGSALRWLDQIFFDDIKYNSQFIVLYAERDPNKLIKTQYSSYT